MISTLQRKDVTLDFTVTIVCRNNRSTPSRFSSFPRKSKAANELTHVSRNYLIQSPNFTSDKAICLAVILRLFSERKISAFKTPPMTQKFVRFRWDAKTNEVQAKLFLCLRKYSWRENNRFFRIPWNSRHVERFSGILKRRRKTRTKRINSSDFAQWGVQSMLICSRTKLHFNKPGLS